MEPSVVAVVAAADALLAHPEISLQLAERLLNELERAVELPNLLAVRLSLRRILEPALPKASHLQAFMLHALTVKGLLDQPEATEGWQHMEDVDAAQLWPAPPQPQQALSGQRASNKAQQPAAFQLPPSPESILQDLYLNTLLGLLEPSLAHKTSDNNVNTDDSTSMYSEQFLQGLMTKLDDILGVAQGENIFKARQQELQRQWQSSKDKKRIISQWKQKEVNVEEQLLLLQRWARRAFRSLPRTYYMAAIAKVPEEEQEWREKVFGPDGMQLRPPPQQAKGTPVRLNLSSPARVKGRKTPVKKRAHVSSEDEDDEELEDDEESEEEEEEGEGEEPGEKEEDAGGKKEVGKREVGKKEVGKKEVGKGKRGKAKDVEDVEGESEEEGDDEDQDNFESDDSDDEDEEDAGVVKRPGTRVVPSRRVNMVAVSPTGNRTGVAASTRGAIKAASPAVAKAPAASPRVDAAAHRLRNKNGPLVSGRLDENMVMLAEAAAEVGERRVTRQVEANRKADTPTKAGAARQASTPAKAGATAQASTPTKAGATRQVSNPTKADATRQADTPTRADATRQADTPTRADATRQADTPTKVNVGKKVDATIVRGRVAQAVPVSVKQGGAPRSEGARRLAQTAALLSTGRLAVPGMVRAGGRGGLKVRAKSAEPASSSGEENGEGTPPREVRALRSSGVRVGTQSAEPAKRPRVGLGDRVNGGSRAAPMGGDMGPQSGQRKQLRLAREVQQRGTLTRKREREESEESESEESESEEDVGVVQVRKARPVVVRRQPKRLRREKLTVGRAKSRSQLGVGKVMAVRLDGRGVAAPMGPEEEEGEHGEGEGGAEDKADQGRDVEMAEAGQDVRGKQVATVAKPLPVGAAAGSKGGIWSRLTGAAGYLKQMLSPAPDVQPAQQLHQEARVLANMAQGVALQEETLRVAEAAAGGRRTRGAAAKAPVSAPAQQQQRSPIAGAQPQRASPQWKVVPERPVNTNQEPQEGQDDDPEVVEVQYRVRRKYEVLHGDRPAPVPGEVRQRIRWSPAETQRVIELWMVAENWSHIKMLDEVHKDGPLLLNRTNVDCKDKIRNLAKKAQ